MVTCYVTVLLLIDISVTGFHTNVGSACSACVWSEQGLTHSTVERASKGAFVISRLCKS